MEPIFAAVLAGDLSRITPAAATQRMDEDLLVAEVPHWLYRGDTPLHLAAAGLRYDAARALLTAGAPVNAVNRRGAAALHYACDPRPLSPAWNPPAQRRVIDLLVSSGAAVDQPDRGGVTPLHRAVRARSPAAVATLLAAGADPHVATGKAGSTPLHLAVAPTGAGGTAGTGDLQLEIIRLLLAAGATLADTDGNGTMVADRIQSQALRDALAAGPLLSPWHRTGWIWPAVRSPGTAAATTRASSGARSGRPTSPTSTRAVRARPGAAGTRAPRTG
jgi:hypothetical protein